MSTAVVNERLAALSAVGTSIWLDQIGRGLINSGELQRLADEMCVRGVTSNPSIFEKAILQSDDYHDDLREHAERGLGAMDIYKEIAIDDVRRGTEVLRPIWDKTGGTDGFVSLEVSPDLARADTESILDEARDFWKRVGSPNLMIKIPGTPEGVEAIEQAIYEGININITLLFAVARYADVAEAYIRGLERRQAEGKSLDVRSVASFFVSRVDSAIDKQLEELGHSELAGKAAIANARRAYVHFKDVFYGERFAILREAGAAVQRPLWASTGTKNPDYSEVLYVDTLAGPDTVNTMPMKTLEAAANESNVTAPTLNEDPEPVLAAIAEAGVDLDAVTDKLLDDGIEAFVHSLDGLIEGIEKLRLEIVGSGEAGGVETSENPEVDEIAQRIWQRDVTLWGDSGTPEIADRLGWLDIAERMREELPTITSWANDVRDRGLTQAVLLGMGGSSLGPEVLHRAYQLPLIVLDSTDPGAIKQVESEVELATTMFVVSSKSGSTIETLSQFEHFYSLSGENGDQFCVVTDPGSPLEALAKERGLSKIWLADPEIGGRYSVLSHFGLVPAALAGIPLEPLIESAVAEMRSCKAGVSENPGLALGVELAKLAQDGRDKLTFVISGPLQSFGLWVEQLIAESTGKNGVGIVPVTCEPPVATEHYGDDRVFVHLRADETYDERIAALERSGHPVIELDGYASADELGALFVMFEFATAVAGHVLGINPFDQPNVQAAKDATNDVLASGDFGAPFNDVVALKSMIDQAEPPTYVAIQAYLQPSDEFDAAIDELRELILDRSRAATTFGYGPRFLHSTGQLHKGGPAEGAFVQLLHTPDVDKQIPGRDFTFEQLKTAQATGDLHALKEHDRPVVRLELTGDRVAALRQVIKQLKE